VVEPQGPPSLNGTEPNGAPRTDAEELLGLVRIAATASLHTAEFAVQAYARTGWRLVAAVTPAPARELAATVERTAREVGQITGVTGRLEELAASNEVFRLASSGLRSLLGGALPSASRPALPSLKESGADLMRRSRDVWNDEVSHPAYARILGELAPDEGRVLMLLLRSGPQPSVDVRTGGPVGMLNSRLIAPGLTMIGPRAGLRHTDQVPAYLNNLFRLGLVWFSRETLRDVHQYQVVEAQPDVLEAMHSVRYAKIVRRSIHLTPFGEDFCRACLVLDDIPDIEALPKHAQPTVDDQAAPPTLAD
jgi:hypothetical protein